MKSKRLLLSIFMTWTLSSCTFFKEMIFSDEQEVSTEQTNDDNVIEEPVPDDTETKKDPQPEPEPQVEPKDNEPVVPVDPVDAPVYYDITFRNYDNSILCVAPTLEGQLPVYKGKEPVRPSSNYEKYNFAGWNPTVTVATANRDYVAKFVTVDVTFTVSFYMDDKKTLIYSNDYKYGQMPTIPNDPVKNETASTIYAFKGWNKKVVAVTGDDQYYAVFTSTTKQYRVTFYDDDEQTVLQTGLWDYGSTPKYNQSTPVKQSSASANYKFKGWNKTITKVTSDQEYVAVYESNTKTYKIRFLNEDGSTLQEGDYEYGVMPSCPEPKKEATENTAYTFAGWEPSITAVNCDRDYKAKFKETVRTYTVKFLNYDGKELKTTTCSYGKSPTYDGQTPTRPTTSSGGLITSYSFVGWHTNKDISSGEAYKTLPEIKEEPQPFYAIYKASYNYEISLKYKNYTMDVRRTVTLLDSKYSAVKEDITWTISNPNVLFISDKMGTIVPLGNGTALITAKFPNGVTHACTIEIVTVKLGKRDDNKTWSDEGTVEGWEKSFFNYSSENDKLTHKMEYKPGNVEWSSPYASNLSFEHYCTESWAKDFPQYHKYCVKYVKKVSKTVDTTISVKIKGSGNTSEQYLVFNIKLKK